LTLALGIGVNTAVLSILNGLLLRKERVAALVKRIEGENAKSAVAEDDDSFDGSSWQTIRENLNGVKLASYGGSNRVTLKTDAASSAGVRRVIFHGQVGRALWDRPVPALH
jgi:hypothetical protein